MILSDREIRRHFLLFRAETVNQHSFLYLSLEFMNWNTQKSHQGFKKNYENQKFIWPLDKLESVHNQDQVNVFFLLKIDLFF